jgi:hypothetical protein
MLKETASIQVLSTNIEINSGDKMLFQPPLFGV